MAISRRRPKTEPPKDLLDLPLSAGVPAAGEPATGEPATGDDGEHTARRPIVQRRPGVRSGELGDVGAIGSLQRLLSGRRRLRWLWLILLLAVPLGALVGYVLKADPPLAALSTDLLDFGEVRMGATGGEQTFRISNQGEEVLRLGAAVVSGEAASDFRVAGDGCAGREIAALDDCTVRLAFAPTDRGARRARIRIDSNAPNGPLAVPLIGVGVAPELVVEPAELDLGRERVGSASAPAPLRVVNRGTAALQLGRLELAGPAAGDFRRVADGCSSRSLLPGERCTVRLAFAPRKAGERRAELQITSDAGAPRAAKLVGLAELLEPRLRIEPGALDFEPMLVGTEGPARALSLANDGNAELAVRGVELEGEGASLFEVSATGCLERPVPPAGACEVEVRFLPTAEGEARALLAIDSSAAPEPRRLPLSGAGIAPRLSIEPGRVSFGQVALRRSSEPRTLRVTSSGSAELRLDGAKVGGADAGAFSAGGCATQALAPGASCFLEVRFRPRRSGPHRAELILEHDAGDRRTRLPLNGLGVTGRLSLDRSRLDFGEVAAGAEARRLLTLRNPGRSELKVLRLRLTGTTTAFELDGSGCAGAVLEPGAACDLAVVFRPTSAGGRSLQLVIDHNAASEPREVPITATATAPPEPRIRVEPPGLTFSDRRVGERGLIKTVTVHNPGTGRLVLEDLELAGDHAGDFQLVAGSCDGAAYVAPGASCTVGVRFAPRLPGVRRGRLAIRHNAGAAAELPLEGYATVPAPNP